jgi:hypothetical protein
VPILILLALHFCLSLLLFSGKSKLRLCPSSFSHLYPVLNKHFPLFFNFVTFVQFIAFLYDMSSFKRNHLLLEILLPQVFQNTSAVWVQHPHYPDILTRLRTLRYTAGCCGLLYTSGVAMGRGRLMTCKGRKGCPLYSDKRELSANSSAKYLTWKETRTQPGPPR